MADELDAAITEIITLMDSITDFKPEPSTPPGDYDSIFPFFVVEPDTFTITSEASQTLRATHGISIQVHLGLPDTITPSDRSEARKYVDLIKDKIFLDGNKQLDGTVDTIETEAMTGNYGLIGYRGMPTVGLEAILTVMIRSKENDGGTAFEKT